MVVVDEVLHADQECVYSPPPRHGEVLGIVPGKMEMLIYITCVTFYRVSFVHFINFFACSVALVET